MYAYLFEMEYDMDGPAVKYGYDVSDCVSEEYAQAISQAKIAKKAAKRLGVEKPGMMRRAITPLIKRDELEDKLQDIRPMFIRAQITGIPLYLIKTDDPMTFDEIDQLMRQMFLKGELRAFLEKAQVK